MLDFKIVIPSYNRADTLVKKTLSLLIKHNIDPDVVYIFVANQEEYEIYKNLLPNEYKNRLFIGVLGIFNQRNFICNYFKEGQYIVSIDDDIETILQKVKDDKYDNELCSIDLINFIEVAFQKLKYNNLYLWGVSMTNNYFHCYKKNTIDLRFTTSAFFGFINRKKMIQKEFTQNAGEDIVRTIFYYMEDGGLLRFNDIILKTKFYEKGGIQSIMNKSQRKEEVNELIKQLVLDYPNFIKEKSNENGFVLIKQPKIIF